MAFVWRACGAFFGALGLLLSKWPAAVPAQAPCRTFDNLQGSIPQDKYYVNLQWNSLGEHVTWKSFPWSTTSRDDTLELWASTVGSPVGLPLDVVESLLLIETSLLLTWHECALPPRSALPPLGAFVHFSNSSIDTVHHPAWLPIALDLALSGDELVPDALAPFLSTRAVAKRHFMLSAKIPPLAPVQPKNVTAPIDVVGSWNLAEGSLGLPLDKGRTKLVYTQDGWMVASLRFVGLPHFRMDYSGRYYIENGTVHHLCLYNSPAAGLENVQPRQGPENYGADRERTMWLQEHGHILVLRPQTFGGKNLTWYRASTSEVVLSV